MKNKLLLACIALVFFCANSASAELEKLGPFDSLLDVSITDSGYNLLYQDYEKKRAFLQKNGKTSGPFQRVGNYVHSGDIFGFRHYGDSNENFVRIGDKDYGPYYLVADLITGEHTYAIVYAKKETGTSRYIELNGVEYGPFDKIPEVKIEGQNWLFKYQKDGLWYVRANNETFGPFDKDFTPFTYVDSYNWGFRCKEGGKYFVISNGLKYGPFDGTSDIFYPKEGGEKWGFIFYRDGKTYLKINAETYGPYNDVRYFRVTEEGWSFQYAKDKKIYVVADKVEKGPFNLYEYTDGDIVYYDKNNIAYRYKKDNKSYFNINGVDHGPYSMVALDHDYKNFGFVYVLDGQYYIYAKDKEYGPFEVDSITEFEFSKKGNLAFGFTSNQKETIYIGDEEYGPYDRIDNFMFSDSGDKWIFTYKNDGKYYVNIDFWEFGPYDKINRIQKDGDTWSLEVEMNGSSYVLADSMEYSLYEKGGLIRKNYSKNSWGYSYMKDGKWYIKYKKVKQDIKQELKKEPKKEDGEGIVLEKDKVKQKILIKNKSMHSRLKGKIMIKVEDAGRAYYINPKTEAMHYLGRPADAFLVMREQGIGITNQDLEKIPLAMTNLAGQDSDGDGLPDMLEDAIGTDKNNPDSDGDGHLDREEINSGFSPKYKQKKLALNSAFSDKQKGKILLQVEGRGEAWYINPSDGKRYFLGRPADAFNVMRQLGLGISNSDFDSLN